MTWFSFAHKRLPRLSACVEDSEVVIRRGSEISRETLATPAAAKRALDRRVAAWLGEGYRLAEFEGSDSPASEAPEVEVVAPPIEQLRERYWSDILEDYKPSDMRSLHVRYFERDFGDPGLDALLADPRLDTTEEIWVEHWRKAEQSNHADHYAEWMEAIGHRAPPALRRLTMGGYARRSAEGHLGSFAELSRALLTLQSLDVQGRTDGFTPFGADALTSLSLELHAVNPDRLADVLVRSTYPLLTRLKLDLVEPSKSALAKVHDRALFPFLQRADLPGLRAFCLAGIPLTAPLVRAIAASVRMASLAVLDFSETEVADEEACVAELCGQAHLLGHVTLHLPRDLDDEADRLEAAGLRVRFCRAEE
jgi:hypothetical protein